MPDLVSRSLALSSCVRVNSSPSENRISRFFFSAISAVFHAVSIHDPPLDHSQAGHVCHVKICHDNVRGLALYSARAPRAVATCTLPSASCAEHPSSLPRFYQRGHRDAAIWKALGVWSQRSHEKAAAGVRACAWRNAARFCLSPRRCRSSAVRGVSAATESSTPVAIRLPPGVNKIFIARVDCSSVSDIACQQLVSLL